MYKYQRTKYTTLCAITSRCTPVDGEISHKTLLSDIRLPKQWILRLQYAGQRHLLGWYLFTEVNVVISQKTILLIKLYCICGWQGH